MKRRDFLRTSIPTAAILPAIVNGYSAKAFTGDSPLLHALMSATTATDHVMVLIQLNGGNDGLNMVIPLEFYGNYFNARPNIAIPQNRVLSLTGTNKTGLHPAMAGLQNLYNDGKVAIVQAVGYPAPNFSHFRATDIWMSGSDSNEVVTNGWAGRYLGVEYPNFPNGFPNNTMPDPLAIQIGSVTSLMLQGPSVNMGMSITDPANFYNLLSGSYDPVPNTPWGKELTYIRMVSQQTQQYAQVIKDAASKVTQQSAYPTQNTLADQLKIVARLIKGGLQTRIYMVSIGGFDTHSSQVNTIDVTTGTHAVLMQRVSDAIKAFMDDLKFLGIEDRVTGLTFSEFGRRIKSNASLGTDHGAAAPMIIFGKKVKPGIIGNNPPIPASATVNDNIPYQYDFRSIYASVLKQWFCVNATDLQTIMLKNFQDIPLYLNTGCSATDPLPAGDELIINYPNPFEQRTYITFTTRGGHTLVQIIDTLGRVVKNLTDQEYTPGTYKLTFESHGLAAGVYYARLQNGSVQQVRSMLKIR
ncbi:MAG TPA: DUF1501 domain-containing protein [Chitinophagaceae bacterium]|nr:DUF1501 domain-containing protein [Chitinophagaceae bacterium]